MLSFAKPEELKIEETNLRSLIDQILRLVDNSARSQGIEIELVYDSRIETIYVDNNLIKQALINILMNSIQSIQNQEGNIQVKVRDIVSENRFTGGDSIFLIEIRDNGEGIPSYLLEKIFDPFYTTKQEGTGLGLSITYSIINRHEGDIEIQSEVGKGTITKIKLPVNANN